MLSNLSIKSLYALALAEGEGMGTAYEYYVKRMALARHLAHLPKPVAILIAGLPERYGTSLDFVLLASELGARLTVVDDQLEALDRLRNALATLANMPGAPPINPPADVFVSDLDTFAAIDGRFDLVLSSEVLQRLSPDGRVSYVSRLHGMSSSLALFCPNADNEAHNSRSGLGGLRLEEMQQLTADGRRPTADRDAIGGRRSAVGFIDMPPFPPGITRSATQREEATSGRFEGLVMWGLGRYAHVERFLPFSLRRRHSHIVYAVISD